MSRINFEPLKIRRLSEIVEESIKDLILTGQLKVGSKLPPEPEISKQFGVSIVTVREALRGLEAFGIIKKKRGKDGGVFISQPESNVVINAVHHFFISKKFSAKDLGEARLIVEPPTVAIAALNITPAEILDIENNIKYCESRIARRRNSFSAKDFFDIEERNVEFHRFLAEATHNPFLALTVDYLMDFLISFKKENLIPDVKFSSYSVRDHRDILNNLKNREPDLAQQNMIRHLNLIDKYLVYKEPFSSDDANPAKRMLDRRSRVTSRKRTSKGQSSIRQS